MMKARIFKNKYGIEDPLEYCKYYKGDDNSVKYEDMNLSVLYTYERMFFRICERDNYGLGDIYIESYTEDGLSDFATDDKRPTLLKATLYAAATKWCFDTASAVNLFKEIYTEYYLR